MAKDFHQHDVTLIDAGYGLILAMVLYPVAGFALGCLIWLVVLS